MSGNDSSENTTVERNEAVVVLVSTKLIMPMISVLWKTEDHEDLRIKTVESAIVSGILCKHRPRIDSPASPWDELHSNLHDPEVRVLRNCISSTGNKKS